MHPLDLLIEFLRSFDEGTIVLATGRYEWFIKTKVRPAQVYLAEEMVAGLPVCQAKTNMYGVSLRPDGFVLYAEVNSNVASVHWTAIAEKPHASGDLGVVREG